MAIRRDTYNPTPQLETALNVVLPGWVVYGPLRLSQIGGMAKPSRDGCGYGFGGPDDATSPRAPGAPPRHRRRDQVRPNNSMQKSAFETCIPTKAAKVPDRPEWIHEIKHDGCRLIVQRDGQRVRLFTRNGHDWSGRFPLITEAALRNRNGSFVIDGEAVLLGVDGRSDFNGLHSRKHDDEVQFYAFDMLVSEAEDLRKLPLTLRKTNLAWLLARRVDGIFLSDFEQGEIGPDLFRHAC
jgi:bifunctional non-homologous end joining protein LigD